MLTGSAQLRYPDRLRLALSFDPGRLAEDLAACAASYGPITSSDRIRWRLERHTLARAGRRHSPDQNDLFRSTAKAFEDTPLLARTPDFREVLAAFGCPLQAVRLMRLAPASVIKEHRDGDLAFEHGAVRLHIPVATNPQVEFLLNGSRVVMEPGSAWYRRLSDPHSVSNMGSADRVHLVIDAIASKWLAAALEEAARH